MKVGKLLKLVLLTGVLLSLGSAGQLIHAQNADEVLMTTQATTTLEQRLTQRKEARTERLTTVQVTRLRARCVAAQTKLEAVSTRLTTATDNRQTVYQNIQTRLSELADKLDGKVDTADLEAALVTLDEKVAAYDTAVATYKQTVADLLEVDCTDDAEGFRASLEAAKTEQTAVLTAAKAVKAHIQDGIKPLLQDIRSQLEDK